MEKPEYSDVMYPVSRNTVAEFLNSLTTMHFKVDHRLDLSQDGADLHQTIDDWYAQIKERYEHFRDVQRQLALRQVDYDSKNREADVETMIKQTGIDLVEGLIRAVYPHLLLFAYSEELTIRLPGKILIELIRWSDEIPRYDQVTQVRIQPQTKELLLASKNYDYPGPRVPLGSLKITGL